MRNLLSSLVFILFTITISFGQKSILQIDIGGGGSTPMSEMRNTFMFASQGYSFNSHVDFFFAKLGLGVAIGYVNNPSSNVFIQHIERKYFESIKMDVPQSWQTKYMVFGPSYRLGSQRWDINIFAKAGISQTDTPRLMFQKYFFNQPHEIFKFTGQGGDFQYIWNAGIRGIYNINSWLGVHLKVDYLSTRFLSQMGYQYSYFSVNDANNNGSIDDPEYMEAEEIYTIGQANLSNLNVSTGLIFKLGSLTNQNKVRLLPKDFIDVIPTVENNINIVGKEEIPISSDLILKEDVQIVVLEKSKSTDNTVEEEIYQDSDIEIPLEEIEVVEAPEAKYDEEAAEFLYKAGESYFAANNFGDAIACFNKIKSDPKYPRAQYMFALAQCATGNCESAQKEYNEFSKNYKESDSRTLEVIFASHLERCKRGDLLVKNIEDVDSKFLDTKPKKEYRVQFVAIKKSNATFPKVAQIGPIGAEFYPNKTLYRYSLEGYTSLEVALEDMKTVRAMGFGDAFIAIYENGIRTKTLYHAKRK